MEQVRERELMNTRVATRLRFVRDRDQAVPSRNLLAALPQRRDLDAVHTIAPCIPLRELRFIQPIFELESVQLAASQFAHVFQLWLDCGEKLRRQRALQP